MKRPSPSRSRKEMVRRCLPCALLNFSPGHQLETRGRQLSTAALELCPVADAELSHDRAQSRIAQRPSGAREDRPFEPVDVDLQMAGKRRLKLSDEVIDRVTDHALRASAGAPGPIARGVTLRSELMQSSAHFRRGQI